MSKKFYVVIVLAIMAFVTTEVYVWSESRRMDVNNEIRALQNQVKVLEFLVKQDIKKEKKKPVESQKLKGMSKLEEWLKKTGKKKQLKEVQKEFGGRVKLAAKKNGTEYRLMLALIVLESGGNHEEISKKGAIGLTQLMPKTAESIGVDPYHPYENIFGGAKYLRALKDEFGSWDAALAAYNMGPTKFRRLLKKGFDPRAYVYVQRVKFLKTLV